MLTVEEPPVADPVDLTEWAGLSDHDLLAGGLADQVTENAAAARRLARLEEYRRRREGDYRARKAADPNFTLTPVQETVIEASELYGYTDAQVRSDLRVVRTLRLHFPGVWQLCRHGVSTPARPRSTSPCRSRP